jgi:hypothetical protein
VSFSGITNLSTFTSSITTTGALGITLAGNTFNFQGPITTQNLGPMVLTNAGDATFSSAQAHSFDGSFTQNDMGKIFMGGSLTTNAQPISIQEDLVLTGSLLINSNGGNITLMQNVDGPYNLTIQAGTGDVAIQNIIGNTAALATFTIASAHDITLHGIGTTLSGTSGTVSLTASNDIFLGNIHYSATAFSISGNAIEFNAGAQVNMTSFGGPITFANGPVNLTAATDLHLETQNGDFTFVAITGSVFENILIDTGTGAAHLNVIGGGGTLNNLNVTAGVIDFAGTIDVTNLNLLSETTIGNVGGIVALQSTNTAYFNALGGDVGTLSNPILINTSNQIYAGADGHLDSLANFNGSSFDNTVHEIPSNPPCTIIFNGVVIKSCTLPPTPTPTPTPAQNLVFPFAVPGVESSFFNLASDYFFFFDFIDDRYFRRNQLMYYARTARSASASSIFKEASLESTVYSKSLSRAP